MWGGGRGGGGGGGGEGEEGVRLLGYTGRTYVCIHVLICLARPFLQTR